ncbi:L-ornithine-N5-monooxygenase [Leptodontidium sp. MPI-SDFR-AT-0119]|nr:L-ornithine-N5-monooxygenase [Leptodontidium sp. MPI-SDFR-AT-0119]
MCQLPTRSLLDPQEIEKCPFLQIFQQYQAVVAVFCSISVHLWRSEHHLHGVKYLQSFVGLFAAATAILKFSLKFSWASSLSSVAQCNFYILLGFSLWFTTQVLQSDAQKKALELYHQYGPYVRVGSSDLMICHPSAVSVIHGSKSKCLRASWYDEDGARQSLHMSRSPQFHHHLRGLWSQQLLDGLATYSGQPVNASKWFDHYSYDVIGDLSFSKDFGMLRSGDEHFAIRLLNEAMGFQGLKLPTWYWQFIEYCDNQLATKMPEEKNEKPSLMTGLLDHHIKKLREELLPLRTSGGTFEHQEIHRATHLNAIINETLRLWPVPPTTIMRKTPPEGIIVEGTYIPGNIHVWTPQYVIGHSEYAYASPYEFVAERWSSKPAMIRDDSGPYRCIGRPLALMQLRLVIAECVTRFDIEFPPGKNVLHPSGTSELERHVHTWLLKIIKILISFTKNNYITRPTN